MSLVPNIANLLRALAVAAYLVSLALSPYETRDPRFEEIGLTILLLGWVSLLDLTAWLANPLVIFCFFRMEAKPRLCSVLSALALLAAYDFAKVDSLGWDSSSDIYFGTVMSLNFGCYLWISSLVLTLLASVAHLRNSQLLTVQSADDAAIRIVLRWISAVTLLVIVYLMLAKTWVFSLRPLLDGRTFAHPIMAVIYLPPAVLLIMVWVLVRPELRRLRATFNRMQSNAGCRPRG